MRIPIDTLLTATETADRERMDKEKAGQRKLAEDWHRQNVQALTNLQKALASIFPSHSSVSDRNRTRWQTINRVYGL